MIIPGKVIAQTIRDKLQKQAKYLSQSKKLIPHLCVLLVGSDPSSKVYVKQKEKVGESLGVHVSVFQFNQSVTPTTIKTLVETLNNNNSVHGIIIQRPVPGNITKDELNRLVVPRKDVDGLHPNSSFEPPVAKAVLKILEWVYADSQNHSIDSKVNRDFLSWLKEKKILVIGRGETGGKPIAETFMKNGVRVEVAHSRTQNTDELIKSSDIVISAVGKPDVVRRNVVTRKTVLIGVGMHPEDDKLSADYNEDEIKDIVAYYTPVPGGVGPVNVACLFENLIAAACK